VPAPSRSELRMSLTARALAPMAPATAGSSNGIFASGRRRFIAGRTANASSRRAGPRSRGCFTSAARIFLYADSTRTSPSGNRTAHAHELGPWTSTPFASAIPPRRSFSSGMSRGY
jgi:hypothetical protein